MSHTLLVLANFYSSLDCSISATLTCSLSSCEPASGPLYLPFLLSAIPRPHPFHLSVLFLKLLCRGKNLICFINGCVSTSSQGCVNQVLKKETMGEQTHVAHCILDHGIGHVPLRGPESLLTLWTRVMTSRPTEATRAAMSSRKRPGKRSLRGVSSRWPRSRCSSMLFTWE